MITPADLRWMQRALELAAEAAAFASPNPAVGCVLVREGEVLSEGAHRYDGRDHAEIVALKRAAAQARSTDGATAYVTLEPCSHHGRTGPCAEALVAAGIARCVVATVDPNPLVRGGGLAKLRAGGVQVEILDALHPQASNGTNGIGRGACDESDVAWEARRLNDAFAFAIQRGRPFVTLKSAISADGMLAPPPSLRSETKPHWLTGEAARADVQSLRHMSDAILTGIGTVQADDPAMTDRTGLPRRRSLLRVVLDAQLRIPLDSRMVTGADGDLLLVCSVAADAAREIQLLRRGVEVVRLEGRHGRVDIHAALQTLQGRGVRSVMVEGGATLNGELLKSDLVDKAVLYFAPGALGANSLPFASGERSASELQAQLQDPTRTAFAHGTEQDLRVSGYLHDPWQHV